ncbi:helix-turn-helix transcriptional regulator [Lacrimispora brassicae]
MEYITINIPSYPYFIIAGDALYRPGDCHRKRTAIGCFDVLFVEYGELFMRDGKNSYHLKKNDILVLHPERTHYGYKNCNRKTYFHWLHFGTGCPYSFSDTFSFPHSQRMKTSIYRPMCTQMVLPTYQTLPSKTFGTVLSVMEQLETQHVDKYIQSTTNMIVDANSLPSQETFLKLLSNLTMNQNDGSSANPTATLCMNYLQNHYEQPVSLEELAKLANCHPTNIIRCFKKEYNTTPAQALIELRLQHGASLLISTGLTCSEIAFNSGFSSLSYFSKTFKKYYHMTPQEYRTRESGMPVST